MTENSKPEDRTEVRAAAPQAETDVTAQADAPAGPAPAAETPAPAAPEGMPPAAAPAAETTGPRAPAGVQDSPRPLRRGPPRTGARRFAGPGRREGRENAEEITDPRMRRPAVYEPRSGPSHSRFNPRQPVVEVDADAVNYKDVTVLTRFIDQQGRILSRRKSRVDAKTQRRIKTAIKQARHLALLPYTPAHIQGHRRRR